MGSQEEIREGWKEVNRGCAAKAKTSKKGPETSA
jgi:hypothetical protein